MAAVAVEFVGLVANELAAFKFPPVGLVVAEDPATWAAFFSQELREETDAVGWVVFS